MAAHRNADPDRSAVYTAEDRLERWFSLGTVTVFGTAWALEPEVKFGQVADVQRYVDAVLAHLERNGWRAPPNERTPAAQPGIPPVLVRRRKGTRKAHYETGGDMIALPDAQHGHAWALREAVVLHELAHHLHAHGVWPPWASASADPTPHGQGFRRTLLSLYREAGHPTAATLLSIAFSEEELP